MNQSIVFFGSGSYTIPIIEKLIPLGLDFVITTEKSGPINDFCKTNNIQIISARSAKELTAISSKLSAHSLGVLASYGAIIPNEIINAFPYGIMNVHPSLLPKFKGPTPVPATILSGETKTGVTIIKMDEMVDHGDILAVKEYALKGDENARDLLESLFKIGAELIEDLIIRIEKGEELEKTPQDHSQETWSEKLTRESGEIDIDNLKAISYQLSAMTRAFYPWPGVWFKTKIKNKELRIKLLPNNIIQVEGKNPMSYKDFINGYESEGRELLEKLNLL